MTTYFDELYYLESKLAQCRAAGETDPYGQPYTLATLTLAIADAGMTPAEHYLIYGRAEGLNPNFYFNEAAYLEVKARQLNSVGEKNPYGDGKWMAEQVLEAILDSGMVPAEHYLKYGRAEALNPNPYFNEGEYLEAKARQLNSVGEKNPYGDREWTAEQALEAILDNGMIPADHYERYGAYETDADGYYINPSNAFDANAYFSAKLFQVRGSGGSLNGKTGDGITMAALIAAMKASAMSPVAHYMLYGADEAEAGGTAMVQTVPVSQRVPNDDAREDLTGQTVPANYNPATPAPKDVDKPGPVPLPADMGGYVSTDISPEVVHPGQNLPVPGDAGYTAPPGGWTHTPDSPLIAPASADTDKATGWWACVDPGDNSAFLIDENGGLAGWLNAGSVTPDSKGNPVIPDDARILAIGNGFPFEASPYPEAVLFDDKTAEVYTVSYTRGANVKEVQSVDFTGVTLALDQWLTFAAGGGMLLQLKNTAGLPLVGEKVAELAAPFTQLGDWTYEQDGAKFIFTATRPGDKDLVAVSYTEAQNEEQSVDCTGLTLAPDEFVTIDEAYFYKNETSAPLTGADLAAAICTNPLDSWQLTNTPGDPKLYFLSSLSNDRPLLEIKLAGAPLTVVEDKQGGASVSINVPVTEVTKGSAETAITLGSTLNAMDVLVGFDPSQDTIRLRGAVSSLLIDDAKDLADLSPATFAALTGNGAGEVGANAAGLFKLLDSHYLLVNDSDVAFNAGQDIVIKLVGLTDEDVAAMGPQIFQTI